MKKRVSNLTVVSNNLPSYLNFIKNGTNRLNGRVQLDNGMTPFFDTEEGTILKINEDEGAVEFQLEARPSINGTVLSYSIQEPLDGKGGRLPFSFYLEDSTGIIRGITSQNIINDAGDDKQMFFDEDLPKWNTPSGLLIKTQEKTPINIALSADKAENADAMFYNIHKSSLPFGIELNNVTGVLSGTVSDIYNGGGEEPLPNDSKVRWVSLGGTLSVSGELEPIDVPIVASSSTNKSIVYEIRNGRLPFGIYLNEATGRLVGTPSEIIENKETTIDFPRLLPIPTWITDRIAPIVITNEKEVVEFQIESIHDSQYGDVQYRIINGGLPFGLVMSKSGLITGSTSEIYDAVPKTDHILPIGKIKPSWATNSGLIGVFEELSPVSVALSASAQTNIAYTIEKGALPFGLYLENGIVKGTSGENIYATGISDEIDFHVVLPKPEWQGSEQLLITAKEKTNVSLQISVTHPELYGDANMRIIEGALPFGLELSKSGTIAGEVYEIVNENDSQVFEPTNASPQWDTVSGLLDTFEELDDVDITLECIPEFEDSTVMYQLTYGSLPYGVFLNEVTGNISGNVGELIRASGVESTIGRIEFATVPRWSTPVGLLAKVQENMDIETAISASIEESTVHYTLIDGHLPFGIVLNKANGEITGNVGHLSYPEAVEVIDEGAPSITNDSDLGSVFIGDTLSIQIENEVYSGRTIKGIEVVEGTLPIGVYITDGGLITGTVNNNSELGECTFKLRIIDSVGLTSIKTFTINIEEEVIEE